MCSHCVGRSRQTEALLIDVPMGTEISLDMHFVCLGILSFTGGKIGVGIATYAIFQLQDDCQIGSLQ